MRLSKQQKILLSVCLLIFLGIKGAVIVWWHNQQTVVQTQTCEVAAQGCPFLQTAVFHLHGVGSAKTPFSIVADNVPANVREISASFRMNGMDMGFNRFDLVKQANGVWRADKVYLPLCTEARNDWTVEWSVDGTKFQAEFQTK